VCFSSFLIGFFSAYPSVPLSFFVLQTNETFLYKKYVTNLKRYGTLTILYNQRPGRFTFCSIVRIIRPFNCLPSVPYFSMGMTDLLQTTKTSSSSNPGQTLLKNPIKSWPGKNINPLNWTWLNRKNLFSKKKRRKNQRWKKKNPKGIFRLNGKSNERNHKVHRISNGFLNSQQQIF